MCDAESALRVDTGVRAYTGVGQRRWVLARMAVAALVTAVAALATAVAAVVRAPVGGRVLLGAGWVAGWELFL